jgi:D-alanyl-D-alanine carboxypeptidase/D-alanyl-D-alanine-endopeptidase (penicillin-binding protein 4)
MSLSKASLDTLFSYTSPNLSELIKCVNYESNNNYAEHLLVESAKENGVSPSIDSAAKFMEAYWSTLFKNQVFFSDGSGLSRKNLITPNAMSGLLIEIINQFDLNDKNVMLNSLPSAGESGTLKYIGGNTVLEGNFIGKSGSMGGVRCYTGYFKKNNDYYPFTVMVNNFLVPDRAIRKAIESLMIDIYSAL